MSALWKARAPITGTLRFQHRAARFAIPLLEKAAQQISLDSGDRPIVIADYGSSQGKNSLAPMRAAIAALRMRVGRQRPIFVCHTDLPANDFSEMFALLESDPESYLQGEPHVFPYAIGRSFYRSLFPPGHVNLGWSSYAAVWLSQIPVQIPDHFFIPCSTGAVRAEFDRQAARDWEAFLTLRAAELRAGGRLVVALPALDHDGTIGFASMMDHANAELFDLVEGGSDYRRRARSHDDCRVPATRAGLAGAVCVRRTVPWTYRGAFQHPERTRRRLDRVSAGRGCGSVRKQARRVFPRGLRAVDVAGPCVDA